MAAEGQNPAFGCHLPPPLPPNTTISDIRGKPWTLGKVLGHGGFGAIYITQPGLKKKVEDGAEYVVKVEPHSNGPLFVELHALLKLGREPARVGWIPRQGGKPEGWVGIPAYQTHGSFVHEGNKLRFLVMTRFGADLEKFFKSGEKALPLHTVLNVGLQVLNSLEFIHSHGYCHNDIKAANILMDAGGRDVYLVDFGLSCKFRDSQGFHCDGGPDDRKAHDGTLEYTSRDAHTGAHSRRGDLESLGYCMLHWAGARLPWDSLLQGDPELVQAAKEACLASVTSFLESCFHPSGCPQALQDYWQYVLTLQFKTEPDYPMLRSLFTEALDQLDSSPHDRLQFSGKTIKVRARKSDVIPVKTQEEGIRKTRSQDEGDSSNSGASWPDFTDPESIMREASRVWAEEEAARRDIAKEEDFERRQEESLLNPTPEMNRLLKLRHTREEARQGLSWKEQLADFNKRKALSSIELPPKETTPQMDQVILIRAQRLASQRASPSPEPSDNEDDDVVDGDTKHNEEEEYVMDEDSNEDEEEDEEESEGEDSDGEEFDDEEDEEDEEEEGEDSDDDNEDDEESSGNATRTVRFSTREKPMVKPPYNGRQLRQRGKIVGTMVQDVENGDSGIIQGGRRKSCPVIETPPRRNTRRAARKLKQKTQSEEEEACVDTPDSSKSTRSIRAMRRSNSMLETPPGVALSPARTKATTQAKLPNISPGQAYVECEICDKNLQRRNLPRHMANVHKRSLPDTPVRGSTGFTPAVKKAKPCLSRTEGQEEEVCPDCHETIPSEFLNRHIEETHSSHGKRTNRRVEDVASRLARVSVSSDSPEKIHNMDSPIVTERRLRNVITSFRREPRIRKPVFKFL